jgi:hypothetical protein
MGLVQKVLDLKRGESSAFRGDISAVIYLMKRCSGLSKRERQISFGRLHYSAMTKTCTRQELEMKRAKKLRKVIQKGTSNVNGLSPK